MRILELEAAARAQATAAAASISRAADNRDAIQNALDLAREQLQQKTDELACFQLKTPPPPPPPLSSPLPHLFVCLLHRLHHLFAECCGPERCGARAGL
jgi:hypothetical protein